MSPEDRHEEAIALLASKKYTEVLALIMPLLAELDAFPAQYEEWLRLLAEAYEGSGDFLAASYLSLYLHYHDVTLRRLSQANAPRALARAQERRGSYLEAARLYQSTQCHAHAAVCFGKAKQFLQARSAWQQLEQAVAGDLYLSALVQANLGICSDALEDNTATQCHLSEATLRLEEAADTFETTGERDQAFDCYRVLAHLGAETGWYENISEGYLNAIRILRADNLTSYALQFYEELYNTSMHYQEFHAAAMAARDAADYCRQLQRGADAQALQQRAIQAWWNALQKNERNQGPPELSENALLAIVDLAQNDSEQILCAYEKLCQLPLPEKKKVRYQQRLQRQRTLPAQRALQATLSQLPSRKLQYAKIWEADLLDWENAGNVLETCADLFLATSFADKTRRNVLRTVLMAHQAQKEQRDTDTSLCQLAALIAEIPSYSCLSVLETMYTSSSSSVRATAVAATQKLYFRRSFRLLRRALRDTTAEVVAEARNALAALHFTHALEPLSRIYREFPELPTRIAVLQSLSQSNQLEAVDILLDVLSGESGELQQEALNALVKMQISTLGAILQQRAENSSAALATLLREILSLRGQQTQADAVPQTQAHRR